MSSTRLRNSGAEVPAQFAHHQGTGVGLDLTFGGGAVEEVLGADVGRHDDHGVAEVDGAALGVGDAAVVEDLQQGVEDIGVRLLDLVEQHDRVRLAAYGLGELAALLVADVSGGAPMSRLTVCRSWYSLMSRVDHVLLGVEQSPGEGLGQLGLPDAGGA